MSNLYEATWSQPQCTNPYLGGPALSNVCSTSMGALFIALLSSIVTTNPKIAKPCERVRPIPRPKAAYDFIVVGGGAAGPVVAARLSELEKWSVLLIEAGPDEPAGTQIPSNLQLYLNTELDWKYKTSNEKHACLNNNGSCSWPRGRNLGGCTSHHGMAYHRGHAKDYQRWLEMGNEGWGWDDVLPYFFKSEDNREIGRVSPKHHATGGPMTVERFRWQPPFAWSILKGAEEAGLGVTEDMVGDQITGATIAQTLSKDGVRQSTAAAYLWPNRDRRNLHVTLNSVVTKIKIDKLRATGVQYTKGGKTYAVKAKREVIIAAGAVNSPQLLLLSGVGPKEDLRAVGVPVVHNLPGVGENLHNHVSFGLDFNLAEQRQAELNIPAADLYLYNQSGPLSSTGLAQVTAILPSSYTTPDDPDIQIFFAGYQAICDTGDRIPDLQPHGDLNSIRCSSVNLHARSRGVLKLQTKNPLDHPYIQSNDLKDPQDIAVLIDGLRAIFALTNSPAMQKHGLTLATPPVKECSNFVYDTDDYWRCAIQWNTRPENHQAGSCKMGPASDPMAVVDPRLRVHGIQGLRVADASIMPRVVSGNPVATINMIGERCADFIKQDWNERT